MRIQRVSLATAIVLLPQLSACVSVQSTLVRDDKPLATAGYVAGRFSVDQTGSVGYKNGVGLGLVNAESGEEYVMPFLNHDKELAMARHGGTENEFGLIQVPPGNYKIAYWVTYGTNISHLLINRNDITDPQAGFSFTVAPSSVVFVGGWSVSESESAHGIIENFTWHVSREVIAAQVARAGFIQTYSNFSEASFYCPPAACTE